jgi:hypothetical protein
MSRPLLSVIPMLVGVALLGACAAGSGTPSAAASSSSAAVTPSATSASLPSIGLLEWTGDVCRYEYNAILAFGGPQLESDDPREVIGYFDTVIRNIDIAFRQFELRANDARVAEARDLAKALVEGFRGMRPGLVNARSALQIATPGDLDALQAAVRAAIAGMDAAQKVYQDTLSRLGVPPLAEMAQHSASCQQLASR